MCASFSVLTASLPGVVKTPEQVLIPYTVLRGLTSDSRTIVLNSSWSLESLEVLTKTLMPLNQLNQTS